MKKALVVALTLTLLPATAAFAAGRDVAEKKSGIEAAGYVWNSQEGGEKIEALKLKGDVKAGKEAFEVCSA